MINYSPSSLAEMIELTNFKVGVTLKELITLCRQAQEGHFREIMVNSSQVRFCSEQLEESSVLVGSYVSFPLGQMSIPSKAFEVEDAISNGAKEVAYLPNLTQLKAGDLTYFSNEMGVVKEICATRDIASTLILDVEVLTEKEIELAIQETLKIAPSMIQINSGYNDESINFNAINLIKNLVQDTMPLKVAALHFTAKELKQMRKLKINSLVTPSINEVKQVLASLN